MSIAADCDWKITVQQSPTTKEWFGAALLPGTKVGDDFDGKRLHTDWYRTELGARTAIEALVSMEGGAV
jgi:hypothetical protein